MRSEEIPEVKQLVSSLYSAFKKVQSLCNLSNLAKKSDINLRRPTLTFAKNDDTVIAINKVSSTYILKNLIDKQRIHHA